MASDREEVAIAPRYGVAKEFKKELVLLCEGPEDARFYEKLIRKRSLSGFEVFYVQQINGTTGGLNGFEPSISAIKAWTSLTKVKLLVLAADNEPKVFGRLKTILRKHAFDYPKKASKIRFTTMLGRPSTAIMLLPLKSRGDLETTCLPILYERWPKSRTCVRNYLKSTGAISWGHSNLDKARLHAIIAGFNKHDPEKTLRDCFSSNVIDVMHESFNDIEKLLRQFASEKL
jgi:hypothetical protein